MFCHISFHYVKVNLVFLMVKYMKNIEQYYQSNTVHHYMKGIRKLKVNWKCTYL